MTENYQPSTFDFLQLIEVILAASSEELQKIRCILQVTPLISFFKKIFRICFYVDHFKSLHWICYKFAPVLCFVSLVARHVGS